MPEVGTKKLLPGNFSLLTPTRSRDTGPESWKSANFGHYYLEICKSNRDDPIGIFVDPVGAYNRANIHSLFDPNVIELLSIEKRQKSKSGAQ